MKKEILSFLLGGFVFLSVGAGIATSTDILTVKPASPKSIIVKTFNENYNIVDEQEKWIRDNSAKGYILKSNSTYATNSQARGITVMEKY